MLDPKYSTAEAYQQLYARSILEILIPHPFPQAPACERVASFCLLSTFFFGGGGNFSHQAPVRHPRSDAEVISPHATDLLKLLAARRHLTLAWKPSPPPQPPPPPPLTSRLPASPVNAGM